MEIWPAYVIPRLKKWPRLRNESIWLRMRRKKFHLQLGKVSIRRSKISTCLLCCFPSYPPALRHQKPLTSRRPIAKKVLTRFLIWRNRWMQNACLWQNKQSCHLEQIGPMKARFRKTAANCDGCTSTNCISKSNHGLRSERFRVTWAGA